MKPEFNKGVVFICSCGLPWCAKYFTYSHTADGFHYLNKPDGKIEVFGVYEFSRLIPLEIYRSPLYQAMKEEETT